jgi:peptidyl-prolyl cis-trans isomerase B (cyclophilin B)
MNKKLILTVIIIPFLITACKPNYLNNATVDTDSNSQTSTMDDLTENITPDFDKNEKYDKAPVVLPTGEIKNKKIVMKTTKGTIEFELLSDQAPLTVSNFVFLTKEKFYDNLYFHRVEPSLKIIQGGDPLGSGVGGPGYTIAEEPPDAELGNPYTKGVVAMAKTAAPNSTGSQFFIMTEDFEGFSPDYSVFGKVISGIEVVQSIVVGDQMISVTVEEL